MTESKPNSISNLQQQAGLGDAQAQFTLACCYAKGSDEVEKNVDLALMWLEKVAEQGVVNAQLGLGYYLLLQIDKELLFPKLTYKYGFLFNGEPDLNEADAPFDFILNIIQGTESSTNNSSNVDAKWLQKAAEQNCAEAQYWLARCYKDGIGCQVDHQMAFDWFSKAAEQDFAEAQYWLACCYLEGEGVDHSDEQALIWLTRVVKQTDVYFDSLNEKSTEVSTNAFPRRLKLTDTEGKDYSQGYAEAYLILGDMYAQGLGCERNDDIAIHWYEQAESHGVALNSEANFLLALRYLEGNGVEKDYDRGQDYLMLAIQADHKGAYQWLANAYVRFAFPYLSDSEDNDEFFKYAIEWCKNEIEKYESTESTELYPVRYVEPYLCLGILYSFGFGTAKDEKKACEYIDRFYRFGREEDTLPISPLADLCLWANFQGQRKDGLDWKDALYILLENKLLDTRGYPTSSGEPANFLPGFKKEIYVKRKKFSEAKDDFEDAFKHTHGIKQIIVGEQITSLRLDEELDKANQELEAKNKQLEEINHRMQKLVEQFTHTLGNVIFPDTIYQVAERLKNNPACRKDVLLLNEAYHAEVTIKLQSELLRQRYANTNPEKFRQLIRACRRPSDNVDNVKSIADVFDYAVSRVIARFLNQHNASLASIRDNILSQKGVRLNALRQHFEDDILLNRTLGPVEWMNQNLRPFKVVELSPLWKKVRIISESHVEALLFGYFSEVLFNAFKYADHGADQFITVYFDEAVIGGKTYLTCSWCNPLGDKTLNYLGSGKGLDAILEDLKQLNDTDSEANSMLVTQDNEQFQVTMFFQKDLLINDAPILKMPR